MDLLHTLDTLAVSLLNAAAKGTVVLLLAWLAVWLCARSSAAVRHAIWSLAMVGLVLLPVASAALPAWRLPILPAVEPVVVPEVVVPQRVEVLTPTPVVEQSNPSIERPRPVMPREAPLARENSQLEPVAAPTVVNPVVPVPASEVPVTPALTARQWTAMGLCAAWALGVLCWGGALLVGLGRTIQLRRRTVLVDDPTWIALAAQFSRRLQLRRAVELREHPDAVVPMTWGIVRPVVLLPRLARAWDESMQRAVLLHELAHVRRMDVASQLIGRVACVLYWFHPLAWFALRRLRQEREQACDDAVVQSGEKASDYAEQLLQVARLCGMPRGLALGVAMAEGSSLETRVKSLFDTARGHGPVSRVVALALLFVGALAVGSIAIVHPVSVSAEESIPASLPATRANPGSENRATADERLPPEGVDSNAVPRDASASQLVGSREHERGRPVEAAQSVVTARVLAALKSPSPLHFDKTPFKKVLEHIADTHGIGISLDSKGLEEVGATIDSPVTIQVDGITLASGLDQVLVPLKLDYIVENEVLMITSAERRRGGKKPKAPQAANADQLAQGIVVDAKPAFTEFVVHLQPFEAPRNGYIEQLKFMADGKCWYKVEGREATPVPPARPGAVFDHTLSPERIRKLNQLLSDTKWLTADDGAKGSPPGLHATTYRLTLKRDGQEKSIVWVERGPEPYRSLMHFLEGIAAQERRVYLHDYLSGQEGVEAWQEVGRELAALRGEPYGKSPYEIDYTRYLPIAIRNVRDFHGKPDEELITSVRLLGYLRVKSDLEFIHRMAQDRRGDLRREVAWTLGQIRDPKSLPVLLGMMAGAGTRWEIGFELIQWGDAAVPGIVKLIELSTKDGLDERERVTGEDMIRAYLQYWDKISQPIHPDVVKAVKQALAVADPMKSIRTTYHQEFLKKVAEVPAVPQIRPMPPQKPVSNVPAESKEDVLKRLIRGGKISTDNLNAMITRVATAGVDDPAFIQTLLDTFDKSCEPDFPKQRASRDLLAVLAMMFESYGSHRWQSQLAAMFPEGDQRVPAVVPLKNVTAQLESEMLTRVIAQGRQTSSSFIDNFTIAVRQTHHAEGKGFLIDVLQNPERGSSPSGADEFEPTTAVKVNKGQWADNTGGSWRDAKFHAAVALAELGEPVGVEWLIAQARPDKFGIDGSVFTLPHARDPAGSLRASSQHSLIDLFGLKPSVEFAELEAWWKSHQGQFHPRPVALGRPPQPPAVVPPQP